MAQKEPGAQVVNVDKSKPKDDTGDGDTPGGLKAPDGGWGWMCVLGAAISNAVFGALVPSFGVTYLALLERYGESATATAWVGAISFAFTGFLGPIVSTLCRYYSCRKVTFTGGVLVAAGLILTGFSPNIFVTYITYGCMVGIGLGLTYTPAFIIIGHYFKRRRALAMAIAGVSTGIGVFASPPIIILILREYRFRGLFLILGGFSLHVWIAAALFRPLHVNIGTSMYEKQKGHKQFVADLKTPGKKGQEGNVSKKEPGRAKLIKRRFSKLFKNPSFLSLSFLMFSFGHTLGLVSSFLPVLAVENNIDETKAALLYTIGGPACSASTLLVGPLLDIPSVRRHRLHIYNIWHIIVGIISILQGVVSHYIAYACNTVIYNAMVGPMRSQQATVIYDIVGQISDAEGLGVALMFNSAGCLVGRSLAGTIKDLFGAYNGAFLLAGSLCLVSSMIFEIVLIRHNITEKKKSQGKENS